MIFRFSCPDTSSQNGKAERMLRTLNNITRTMLHHASLPLNFRNYALEIATYLRNILPTKTFTKMTLFQALFQKIPSYDHLRVFGCLCYPNLSSTSPHKLTPRFAPCIFLGFPPNHRGYRCHNFTTQKFIISQHVTFVENNFPYYTLAQNPSGPTPTPDATSPLLNPYFWMFHFGPEHSQ